MKKQHGFLGSRKKNYFEGWYYKLTLNDYCISFIAGISKGDNSHGFVQVLDTNGVTEYLTYPLEQVRYNGDDYWIKVGDNSFGKCGISLSMASDNLNINGRVDFVDMIQYPCSALSKGIMGIYGMVPALKCYHDVISIRHTLVGALNINGVATMMDGGVGYLEKTWGSSFPSEWWWMQADKFGDDTSMMATVAEVAIGPIKFKGVLAFVHTKGKLYKITTPTGAKLIEWDTNKHLKIANKSHTLEINVISTNPTALIAPKDGSMTKEIFDDINATIRAKLTDHKGNTIFEGQSNYVGLEYNKDS